MNTVSVVIAAYAQDRRDQLREAVASVLAQSRPAMEIVVVVDHNPALLARAQRELPAAVTVLTNTGARGASGARNTGVAACHGDVIAFLDDDARASAGWLDALLRHFDHSHVVGAGGRVSPLWASSRPRWFPPEFDWTIGASYHGMPETVSSVRNVWSCNMAIRRTAFDAAGGFRAGFGKVGSRSRPEDTDLCLRATGTWVYEPAGLAGHWVPRERATVRYFLRRCFHEGRGKAGLAALDGAGESISTERHYVRHVLPRGVARGVRDALRGDGSGALRSAAITAGLSVTAAGFIVGLLAGSA